MMVRLRNSAHGGGGFLLGDHSQVRTRMTSPGTRDRRCVLSEQPGTGASSQDRRLFTVLISPVPGESTLPTPTVRTAALLSMTSPGTRTGAGLSENQERSGFTASLGYFLFQLFRFIQRLPVPEQSALTFPLTISEPDPGLSEEPEDTSLDRRERRKRRSADKAKKKAKFRSRQRVTMVTISEPDPGIYEDPDDKSLDREETRKRRFDLWLPITLVVSLGLLIILTISLRLSSVMPTEEEGEAPNITEFHSSTHGLSVGQTARYTCHASGTPEPTVEWLHNGRPLERDGTDNQSDAWVERGFLFVRGVRYGVNTVCCMASNSAGTANHSAELLVFDACDLTLDPNTAHRDLSLSEDNRKVTRVGEDQSYPDHPDRFDFQPQVLGREALTGRCYWEVEWEGEVSIGVTYRGITRRGAGGDSMLGENGGRGASDSLS
ncbi:unnamed protein product [Boreogadus saida]